MLPDKGYMPVIAAVNEELPRRVHAHSAAAAESTVGGVSRVIIADGRIQNPILYVLLGNGTIIQ